MAEIIKMPDGRKKLERLVELMYQTDYGTAEYIRLQRKKYTESDAEQLLTNLIYRKLTGA